MRTSVLSFLSGELSGEIAGGMSSCQVDSSFSDITELEVASSFVIEIFLILVGVITGTVFTGFTGVVSSTVSMASVFSMIRRDSSSDSLVTGSLMTGTWGESDGVEVELESGTSAELCRLVDGGGFDGDASG